MNPANYFCDRDFEFQTLIFLNRNFHQLNNNFYYDFLKMRPLEIETLF